MGVIICCKLYYFVLSIILFAYTNRNKTSFFKMVDRILPAITPLWEILQHQCYEDVINFLLKVQYIPRNMHTVFALLCFAMVIHWLIFPYPSGLLHWHCGNLTIVPVPAKQPWWIWINTSCEFIMNDCITTTKHSTTKPCAYFVGFTVVTPPLMRTLACHG